MSCHVLVHPKIIFNLNSTYFIYYYIHLSAGEMGVIHFSHWLRLWWSCKQPPLVKSSTYLHSVVKHLLPDHVPFISGAHNVQEPINMQRKHRPNRLCQIRSRHKPCWNPILWVSSLSEKMHTCQSESWKITRHMEKSLRLKGLFIRHQRSHKEKSCSCHTVL